MKQQLSLELEPAAALPSRLAFAMPSDGGVPFDDEARYFEPWWPGAQAYLRLDRGHVRLQTQHLSEPLLAFPELGGLGRYIMADGVIIEGTLLALDDDGRPDPALLRRRLADPGAAPADGAFVASDLLYVEARSLARQPFVERRGLLADVVRDSEHGVVGRGLVGEGSTLAIAVASLGLSELSARRLQGRWRPGPAGDDWMRLAVTDRPARPTRPFLVLLQGLPLDPA